MNKLILSTLFGALALSACSSDSDNNSTNTDDPASGGGGGGSPVTEQGVFLDSAVFGLTYTSGETTGTTDANGTFSYEPGEPVTFSIGGIILGSADGADVITPVELVPGAADETNPTVANIVRFLLSLDDDGDPSNGIAISTEIAEAAADMTINFDQTTQAFTDDGDVQVNLSTLTALNPNGAVSLVSTADAQIHFSSTLIGLFVGSYSGTFDGDISGSYSFTVDEGGAIDGSGSGDDGGFEFTGQLSSDGTAAAGSVDGESTVFVITLERDGSFQGTWRNDGENIEGTVSGQKDS
jgi:hypothetical protein